MLNVGLYHELDRNLQFFLSVTCHCLIMGLFTKERITFRKTFRNVIRTLSWFESLILPFVNATLFQIRLLKRILKRGKRGVLDRDPRRKPDSRTCERKALSERDLCVCILEMRAEAMHGSISADCAVGTKYYLTVRRSCSWLGRRLQCMWTHVVQITIPITKRIAIRNVYRNVIRSFLNTAIVVSMYSCISHWCNWMEEDLQNVYTLVAEAVFWIFMTCKLDLNNYSMFLPI